LTKTNFEQFSDLNIEFFESAKKSLLDPLGLYLANDVKWIKLNDNWNSSKFPVVVGGKGQPILLLHGFDSSFLEFRRIYQSLKRNFQVIAPDLLGFGFSPRCATNEYDPSKIILHLIDLLKTLQITKNLKIIGASMGGSVALKLAFEISDSIDKIILLSPPDCSENLRASLFLLTKLAPHFLDCRKLEKVFADKHLLSQMNLLVKWKSKLLQFI